MTGVKNGLLYQDRIIYYYNTSTATTRNYKITLTCRFSRNNGVHFERDWIPLFSVLYSPDIEIKDAAKKLFLLEVGRTEDNEDANDYTLLEVAINAYRWKYVSHYCRSFCFKYSLVYFISYFRMTRMLLKS